MPTGYNVLRALDAADRLVSHGPLASLCQKCHATLLVRQDEQARRPVEQPLDMKRTQEPMDTAQTTPPSQPNPALKALEFLVGDWTMELSNASFLPRPTDKVSSPVSFEWVQDGAFLAMRMGDKSSTPAALWLFQRDESAPGYTVLYYDARRVSRVYAMSFAENAWKIWREAPGFWQRFTGTVSPDRTTIRASWEKSPDGITWEHDFDVTYTKAG